MKIKLNVKHYINYIFGNNNMSKENKLKEKRTLDKLSIEINNILPRSHAPSPPPVNILLKNLVYYNKELKLDTKVESSQKKKS